jgi:hypothetical protein
VSEIFDAIHTSGLYSRVDEIRCTVQGDYSEMKHLFTDKVKIWFESPVKHWEKKTMELIYRDSTAEDFDFLYLHSKGVRHNGSNPCVTSWTRYMLYFNVTLHEKCLEALKTYDAVGVNLQVPPLHYSGNFWWSSAKHVRKIGLISDNSYNGPEFYITLGKDSRYLGLWSTNVNHYHVNYTSDNYVDKGVNYNEYRT